MSFLIQLKPVSKLAYIALGLLCSHFVFPLILNRMILSFTFLLSLIFLFRGYARVFAILLGFSLTYFQSFQFSIEEKPKPLEEMDFEILKKSPTVEIKLLKEVKRNFYESEIEWNNLKFRTITKRNGKSISLPSLLCPSNLISLKKPPDSNEYFRFLKNYHSIYLQIRESKCKKISESTDSKKLFRKQIEELLLRAKITDYANDIAMGLYFGDASYLDNEFKEKVREGGVLHLFAASGLHIGVLIGFLFFIAKRIWFLNYYSERILPLLLAFSYLYLLNFPVSLVRAYIFASILVLGNLVFRKMKSIDLILISAGIIFFFDKENFLTLSFTLSYSAVCGILFLKTYLDKLLFQNLKNFFTENLTISISASLGTYPVLLFYFQTFSFGSIFLNLILVPLTSLLLPLLYISLFFQYLYEFLIKFLKTRTEQIVSFQNSLNENPFSVNISNFLNNLSSNLFLTFSNSKESFLISILEKTFSFISEILWSYSELLLRLLAFLSEKLSDSVGFYRSVKYSFSFHIGFYLCLFFFLILGFFLLECKFYLDKNKSITSRIRNSISVFFLFLIFSFFYFGYILFPEINVKPSFPKNVSAGSDYYLVKENGKIYLGGVCKYSQFQIQKILQQGFCEKSTDSIFIEEESCLFLANLCKKASTNANIFVTKELKDWENVYPFLKKNHEPLRKNFSNLLIFYPHIDSLRELQKNTNSESGNILLLFAYKLNDNAKDWNENKNILGINPNWIFITPDEL